MRNKFSKCKFKLNCLIRELVLLNPKNILDRGYSIIQNSKGEIISKVIDLKQEDKLTIILSDGEVKITALKDTSL
jgi:exodeoxyribonuclease VII large subunit